ncbi:hypothetical protein BG005_004548 [Podila minutissima]|nr:hypothetical protein BG005_004548 [Podila minutissima]
MPPLASYLQRDMSQSDRDVLNAILAQGIKSDSTLILDPNAVVAKTGGKVSKMVIDGLLHRVIMPSIIESVPKPVLASEMCSGTSAQEPPSVSSGWASIDRILGGQGWLAGQVNEICGASGCGKTQICLVSAVKLLLDHSSSRVIWIETSDGNFSAERAYNTAKAQLKKQSSEAMNADQGSLDIETRLRHVLDRIVIYTCPDINSLLNAIQGLHEEVTPCADSLPTLVVIDPLSAILTNLLWATDGAVNYGGSSVEWSGGTESFDPFVERHQTWPWNKLAICDGSAALYLQDGDPSESVEPLRALI